jgi:cobalt-zinc-cadmium resistance protein CzcA
MTELYHDAQRPLSLRERLQTVALSAREMIAFGLWAGDHHPGLCPTSHPDRRGGKTFVPMALTVIIALIFAFILSLTCSGGDCHLALTRVEEKEGRIMGWLKARYGQVRSAHEPPQPDHRRWDRQHGAGGGGFQRSGAGVSAAA